MAMLPRWSSRSGQPSDPCAAARASAQLGACEHALESKQVTFHDVATAWFGMTDPRLGQAERDRFAACYPKLRELFAVPRGGIVTAVFCRYIRVAAALTSSDQAARNPEGVFDCDGNLVAPEQRAQDKLSRRARTAKALDVEAPSAQSSAIHVEPSLGDPVDWRAKAILFRCQDLHNRAIEFLTPKPRKICMRRIFGVIVALLGMLDARALEGNGELKAEEVTCLERELDLAERYVERSMQRQAQLEYFVGMLWSWIAIVALFGALAGVFGVLGQLSLMAKPLVLASIVGGLGAVVSVMQRMTSGSLRLAAEDGRRTIRILGAIRPVLGAIFGVFFVVLLLGKLIPIDGKPAADGTLPYFAGLAFVAGFSERFAQDMLSGVAGRFSGARTAES